MPKPVAPRRHPLPPITPAMRALTYVGEKWTLGIIEHLEKNGPTRFVEIQRGLKHGRLGISTEQLRSRLNRMVEEGLLTRQRYREVPPRVDYEVTDKARELAGVLRELTVWGERHTTERGALRS